jgi:hypothetical protein
MRPRSVPYLAIALLSWFLVWRFLRDLMRTPCSYEFGSIAFPVPLHIKLLVFAGLGSAFVASPVLLCRFHSMD